MAGERQRAGGPSDPTPEPPPSEPRGVGGTLSGDDRTQRGAAGPGPGVGGASANRPVAHSLVPTPRPDRARDRTLSGGATFGGDTPAPPPIRLDGTPGSPGLGHSLAPAPSSPAGGGAVEGVAVEGGAVGGGTLSLPPRSLSGGLTQGGADDSGASARPRTARLLAPGEQVGHYVIEREIARGGMGLVLGARDATIGREVALKVMLDLGSEDDRRRFLVEAEAAGRLRHAAICQVYEAGEQDGIPFIAMELIDGCPLTEHVSRERLGGRAIASLMADVADGVAFAHMSGVIHRDLKPANVFVDRQAGTPKIMDFGIAKVVEAGREGMTVEGSLMGTPAYMAPEQARGEGGIDVRADVYALGVMLYELLCGQRPFTGGSVAELIYKVTTEEPRPPRAVDPTVDWELEAIALKAIEKMRERRYPSARELAEDLRRFVDGRPIQARRAGPLYRFVKLVRRNRGAFAGAFAAVLALVGAGGFLGVRWRQERVQQEERLERALGAGRGHERRAQATLESYYGGGRATLETEAARVLLSERVREPALAALAAAAEALTIAPDLGEALALAERQRQVLREVDRLLEDVKAAEVLREEQARLADEADLLVRTGDERAAELTRRLEAAPLATGADVQEAQRVLELSRRYWIAALGKVGEHAGAKASLERSAALAQRVEADRQRIDTRAEVERLTARGQTDRRAAEPALAAAREAAARLHPGGGAASPAGTSTGPEAGPEDAPEALAEALAAHRAEAALLLRGAVEAFDVALRLAPEDPEARRGRTEAGLRLVELSIERGNLELADYLLDPVAALAPAEAEPVRERIRAAQRAAARLGEALERGELARERGRFAEAEAAFGRALEIDPASPAARYGRLAAQAGLAESAGQLAEAVRLAREARAAAPGAVKRDEAERGAARVLGRLVEETGAGARRAMDQGDAAGARAAIASLRDVEPDHPLAAALERELAERGRAPPGFVYVAAGAVPFGPDARAQPVACPAFAIALREVTAAEYARFVEAGGYADAELFRPEAWAARERFRDKSGAFGPAEWSAGRFEAGQGDLPVTGVSFFEAEAYARWRGFRLPSSLEWEKAATWDPAGARRQPTPWAASEAEAATLPPAWAAYFGMERPKAAGAPFLLAGPSGGGGGAGEAVIDRSPIGVEDIYGNVHEWCRALPQDPQGGPSVARGGSFLSLSPERAHALRTHARDPWLRHPAIGFRLAADVGD